MFNANLPQSLGSPVIRQLEANGAFKLFILWKGYTACFTFNTYIYRQKTKGRRREAYTSLIYFSHQLDIIDGLIRCTALDAKP